MPEETLYTRIETAAQSAATNLWLYDQKATSLPPEVGDLVHLTELAMSCESLTTLPPEIGSLVNLTTLELRESALVSLPQTMRSLQQLRSLRLTSRSAEPFIVPDWIGELGSLETLVLSGPIEMLPAGIGRLQRLQHISISRAFGVHTDYALSRLPEEFGRLEALTGVYLSSLRLSTLPRSIGALRSLESLHLERNLLEELPEEIGGLRSLRDLRLGGNRLAHLPNAIGRLVSLEDLRLDRNLLTNLPSEIGGLAKLRRLDLHENRLSQLPSTIGGLRALSHLDVRTNQLTELPSVIGQLTSLVSLRATGNRIRTLPLEIRRLRHLANVELLENQPDTLSVNSLTKEWDVFISHAAKDKETVAAPLAEQLRRAGLRVWLDQQEIRIGDSIRRKIDEGLSRSRFGIVVISPAFVERDWTARELGALFAIEDEGQRVILPVWHDVDKRDVTAYSPILSDIAAADTRQGLFAVASAIVDKVLYEVDDSPSTLRPSITRQAVEAICRERNVLRMCELLVSHARILKGAYAQFGDDFDATRVADLGRCPTLLISSHQYSAATTIRSYVLFGSAEIEMFDASLRPQELLDAAIGALRVAHREHAKSEPKPARNDDTQARRREHRTHWGFESAKRMGHGQPSVIVFGRRHALGPDERDGLNDLNANLAPDGIRVRSYDWLFDAFRSWERESARGQIY